MNFLYPLFLAGIAAIGIPIVLHMIRQRTRKRVKFSSLMFVPVSTPRFKNRSRIENLPLLILRCLIFCLLAFAFSRPFFKQPPASDGVRLAERIVLLIDTSASMRRTGIWPQVQAEAKTVLAGVDPSDRVCVMSFDQGARILMGFEQWDQLEPAQRTAIANRQISELSPGWAATDLGGALVAAAETIEDDEINDAKKPIGIRRVVLISDMQQGAGLEALSAYEWPKEMDLVVKSIQCPGRTNAALQLVTGRGDLAGPDGNDLPGIRITNSADATAERFQLNWVDESEPNKPSRTLDVYVPPGHSIVVPAPARPRMLKDRKLTLTGDDHDFDNTLYIAPALQQQVNILYIGRDDPNDPSEMLYYVRRAFSATDVLKPRVVSLAPDRVLTAEQMDTAHLVIATEIIRPENTAALRRYLESGRTLLLVLKSTEAVKTVADLAGIESLESTEADVDRYVMLDKIEFKHPLLTLFSEPRFGDFTQIHFWKYRRIDPADCPGARVLAWFDSDDPAWLELPVGKGAMIVFTSAFHPADSQFALSSKFVPLLYSILEYGGVLSGRQLQYFVGDGVPMPRRMTSAQANVAIRKPDKSLISIDAEKLTFAQTDLPGIYAVESPPNRLFAVNVPAAECKTAPMPIEDIENLGVSFKQSAEAPSERNEKARYQSNLAEIEYEQKLWRWVLVATLVVLLLEIALAGWLTRPAAASKGE